MNYNEFIFLKNTEDILVLFEGFEKNFFNILIFVIALIIIELSVMKFRSLLTWRDRNIILDFFREYYMYFFYFFCL